MLSAQLQILRLTIRVSKYLRVIASFYRVIARTCYETESGFQKVGYSILTITLYAKLVKVHKDSPVCVIS